MPTVEEMNDVAPALQASRSGPRKAAGRVNDEWWRENEGPLVLINSLVLAFFVALFVAFVMWASSASADLLDRSERAQPEATPSMEGE